MGLSRTVYEINGDFGRKSPIFPTAVYFAPPLKGSHWNWILALDDKQKKTTMRYAGIFSLRTSLLSLLVKEIRHTKVSYRKQIARQHSRSTT